MSPSLEDLRRLWSAVCENMEDDGAKLTMADVLMERQEADDLAAARGLRWCVENRKWPKETVANDVYFEDPYSTWVWQWGPLPQRNYLVLITPEEVEMATRNIIPNTWFPEEEGKKGFGNLWTAIVWLGEILPGQGPG